VSGIVATRPGRAGKEVRGAGIVTPAPPPEGVPANSPRSARTLTARCFSCCNGRWRRFPFASLSASIEKRVFISAKTASLVRRHIMRVSDILRVKGNALFTVTPDTLLADAVNTMAEHDIGSLVVMEYGDLVGMLTFREILLTMRKNGGGVGTATIRKVMDDHPVTCTPETDVNEVRRMMLEHHVRYLPVLDKRVLMGVISFYDVAKTVLDEQGFENKMLKAYIRDWPDEEQRPTAQ
jgi:CBS domain-containing protein